MDMVREWQRLSRILCYFEFKQYGAFDYETTRFAYNN